MTRYTLTFLDEDYQRLVGVLSAAPGVENAAYLLCRQSTTTDEVRLLVREIVPVSPAHILEASPTHMSIASASYRAAMKRADNEKSSFVFVHTHPGGVEHHSEQDDRQEEKLFRTAYSRIHSDGVHASLVFTEKGISAGRVWLPDGTHEALERVRIIGDRYRFWFSARREAVVPDFFDRQVRAFGSDLQVLLGRLRVGVVGAGGTGSAVIEQLTRLGIGELLVADGDTFERSNLNRVYGSRAVDGGIPKIKIAERLVTNVGSGTKIEILEKPITFRSALARYRDCDVIFGCTDDEWGRSLLTRVAIYYGIPVFDLGVKIDSYDGIIRSIQGRVTTLAPGAACLFCRGRITSERVGIESQRATDPEGAADRVREGYAPELEEPAPAVVPFTTAVAASAISTLLHRLTGFMGEENKSTELLHLFDVPAIRRNSKQPAPSCFCSEPSNVMRGDTRPLLDSAWRPE